MSKADENVLMNNVRLALQEKGCLSFRCNVGKVRTPDGRFFDTGLPKGFSDLLVILPDGRACFIETKVKPRKPSKEQCEFLLAMIKRNSPSGVAFTVEQALDIANWDETTKKASKEYIQSVLESYKKKEG